MIGERDDEKSSSATVTQPSLFVTAVDFSSRGTLSKTQQHRKSSLQETNTKNGKTFGNEIEFMRILHLQLLNLTQPSSELISIYLFIGWYCDNNGIFIHDQDLFPYLNHIHVHKLFTMAV